MLSQAMGGEIRWSRYLNDLSLRMPDHVWLTNVSTSETGATATTLPTTTTSGTLGSIGNIQFTRVSFTHDDVATWLDTLSKERGFVNAYFTNSAETAIG